MPFSQTPARGWSRTQRHVGLFVVNPSIEYNLYPQEFPYEVDFIIGVG